MLDKEMVVKELDMAADWAFENQINELRQFIDHLLNKINGGDFDIKEK